MISYTKVKLKYLKLQKANGKSLEVQSICNGINKSIRTLQRWEASYFLNGLESATVKKSSGRPVTSKLSNWAKGKVKKMRTEYRWGSEVIQAHILRDNQKYLTRYSIEQFLTNSMLRNKFPCTTMKRIKNIKKREHNKKVKVLVPGFHTQMDVKFLMEKCHHKKRLYVYNFIDHASNWSYKEVYEAHTTFNTIDFMMKLLRACPFKIYRIQTDNGTEFTNKYMQKLYLKEIPPHPLDQFCEEFNIIHRCIPVGEKELQGLVERSNRQDDQELYIKFGQDHTVEDLRHQLRNYMLWRNSSRRFKKNNWSTPEEYLDKFRVVTMATYMYHQKQKERAPTGEILHLKVLQEFGKKKESEEIDFKRFVDYKLSA